MQYKFRAWDKKRTGAFHSMLYQQESIYDFMAELKEYEEEYGCEFELILSTNLTDKNGKEIYDSDIVEGNFLGEGIRLAKVVFMDGAFWFYVLDFDKWLLCGRNNSDIDSVGIIGNIYEHPNLLEK